MDIVLRILSWLYGAASWVRNTLYNEHLLRSRSGALPTICVGNLAVGGTGKTPHVEYLIRLLQENGYSVGVLSRGYKRKTKGFVLANPSSTAETIGDESMQLYRKYPAVPIAVCEDRLRGLEELRQLFPTLHCVLLDDAFQHRRLKPGFSMILTQADRIYVEDHYLPLGRLRESSDGEYRADMVVVTKCPDNMQPIDRRCISNKLKLPPFKPLIFTRMKYGPLHPVFPVTSGAQPTSVQSPSSIGDTQSLALSAPVLLLTGIAQPQYILAYMQERYSQLTHLAFPDHHAFSKADIQKIVMTYQQNRCTRIITTEKDATRLREAAFFPKELKNMVFFQPIEVEFLMEDQQSFDNYILHYVRQSNLNR